MLNFVEGHMVTLTATEKTRNSGVTQNQKYFLPSNEFRSQHDLPVLLCMLLFTLRL